MKILLIFFILFSQIAFSQDCILEGKSFKLSKKITTHIAKGKLKDAIKHLKEMDQTDAFFDAFRAEIAWLRNDDFTAEEFGNNAVQYCPNSFPNVYYLLGEISYRRKDYRLAASYLKKSIELGVDEPYLSNANKYYDKSSVISDIIDNPVDFEPQFLEGVSSKSDEYLPAISADQESVYYTRRYIKKGIDFMVPSYEEEFMVSRLVDSKFDIGQPMPSPFNQGKNEGGATLSIDNKNLYFTSCSKLGSYNNCDIFKVQQKDGKWLNVKAFGDRINSPDSWESQPSVSVDGNSIIFASDRKGGYGGIDLYVIYRQLDGVWSKPENLGPVINTKDNEKSPFIHIDNQTLFFSSEQFPSIGGYDIFYSRKDSLGNWQEPKNIGYPINTVSDEIAVFVSTDGSTAYFSSNQLDGVGGWDVYSFNLHKEAKPKRVLFLKGYLTDELGNLVNDVELQLENLNTEERYFVQVEEGVYTAAITLEDNDDVLLTLKKDGYAFNSEYLSASDTNLRSPSKIDFNMFTLGKGKSFTINDILFSTNSSEISMRSKHVLDAFSEYLLVNSHLNVSIHGHTDNVGTKKDNLDLSSRRAERVYSYILSQGVDGSNVSFQGFGEKYPIADNNTELGRSVNRRTEFFIE